MNDKEQRARIEGRRIALGLSRDQLGARAGVTGSLIWSLERNPDKFVKPETIARVVRALDDAEGEPPMTHDQALRETLRRIAAIEEAMGITPPSVDPTAALPEQVERRIATLEARLASELAPREAVAPPERQPSGPLDQSIARQNRQAAQDRKARPSK